MIRKIAGRLGASGGERGRRALAIVLVALLAFSVVAPFLGFVAVDAPTSSGTAVAGETVNDNITHATGGSATEGVDYADGSTLYSTSTSSSTTNGAAELSPNNTVLYVGTQGGLVARDPQDGTTKWTRSYASHIDGVAVTPDNSTLFAGSEGGGFVEAIHQSDRTTKWNASVAAGDLSGSPSGNYVYAAKPGKTTKLRVSDGIEVWNVTYSDDASFAGVFAGPNGDYVYNLRRPTDPFNTQLQKRHAANGSLVWTNAEDVGPYGHYGGLAVSRDGSGVVAADKNTNVTYYDAETGNVKWRYEDAGGYEQVFSPDGQYIIFLDDNQNMAVLDKDTGTLVDKWATGLAGSSGVAIKGYNDGHDNTLTNPVDGTITNSSDGTAIGGATVELKQSGSVVDSTTADSSGYYKFTGVSDGDYTVEASNDGYKTNSEAITVSGSAVTQDVALDPVLVTGYVTDAGGNPIGDAKVTLEADGSVLREMKTNSSGGYEFVTVTDGSYTVAASSSDHDDAAADISVSRATVRQDFELPANADGAGSGQAIGLVEDELGLFAPDDTELIVHERTTEYRPLWEVSGDSPEDWQTYSWGKISTTSFNADDKSYVELTDGGYYRLELHSSHGTWEDSGFRYDKSEMLGSTIWLEPSTGHTDTNDDGTIGGDYSSGTNGGGGSSGSDTSDGDSTNTTEDQGFGPTAIGPCTTTDGQDGVEVEYWDPDYTTYELRANLSVDGDTTYFIHKTFDEARGYYRGCLADHMTRNASESRDTVFTHNATNATGYTVSSGSTSYSPPVFGPTGVAPESTGERLGLLAGVLGAFGALWFGGQKYVPGESVAGWPVDSVSPVFAAGAPIVGAVGLDLAGGGVISAGVATGLAQIAPFAGMVGVSVAGYYALRWIRAPPS